MSPRLLDPRQVAGLLTLLIARGLTAQEILVTRAEFEGWSRVDLYKAAHKLGLFFKNRPSIVMPQHVLPVFEREAKKRGLTPAQLAVKCLGILGEEPILLRNLLD